jgi:hypothetical protein
MRRGPRTGQLHTIRGKNPNWGRWGVWVQHALSRGLMIPSEHAYYSSLQDPAAFSPPTRGKQSRAKSKSRGGGKYMGQGLELELSWPCMPWAFFCFCFFRARGGSSVWTPRCLTGLLRCLLTKVARWLSGVSNRTGNHSMLAGFDSQWDKGGGL